MWDKQEAPHATEAALAKAESVVGLPWAESVVGLPWRRLRWSDRL